ncbi:hypothetical protein KIH78_02835 [Bifidobacterium sp. 79T10]|nr:hypothetical protein [Bifidobacterium saguinibicoloris]
MSTSYSSGFSTPGTGSVRASRTGFIPTPGSAPRPSRPGQLAPALLDQMSGGADPGVVNEIAHSSAAALLDRVRHSEDPMVVERVLTIVEREGVDEIAELWSSSPSDSLPGVLWRLYMLRAWMRAHRDAIARLWRVGEPVATSASAIAGVDQAPTEDDIVRLADSILSGAFTGDFAVAMERAAAFTDVVALGLRVEAKHLADMAGDLAAGSGPSVASGSSDWSVGSAAAAASVSSDSAADSAAEHAKRHATRAARLMHTAANLLVTAKDFQHAANLWRRGKLE